MRDFRTTCPLRTGFVDHWRLYENTTEFLAMPVRRGYDSYTTDREKLSTGDATMVAPSEKFLREFEGYAEGFLRQIKPIRPSICGSVWNVPAVLAGHPMAARARIRDTSNHAPLTVLVDCGVSGGVNETTMAKRGAAILALVRLLANVRPVTLWVGETNPDGDGSQHTSWDFIRVDTRPLDLARAAWMIGHVNFTRAVIWGTLPGTPGWPRVVSRALTGPEMQKCARGWAGETLCITAAYLSDPLLNEPKAWLKEKLDQLQ